VTEPGTSRDVKQTQGVAVFIAGWFLLLVLMAAGEGHAVALRPTP
jgi:hypothetical protein